MCGKFRHKIVMKQWVIYFLAFFVFLHTSPTSLNLTNASYHHCKWWIPFNIQNTTQKHKKHAQHAYNTELGIKLKLCCTFNVKRCECCCLHLVSYLHTKNEGYLNWTWLIDMKLYICIKKSIHKKYRNPHFAIPMLPKKVQQSSYFTLILTGLQ